MTATTSATPANPIDLVLNPGSERNLISICLRDADKIIDVESAGIFAEHFSVPGHKFIFMAMMYLYGKKIKPSPLAIMEVLSNDHSKDAVSELGGLEYLSIMEETSLPPESIHFFMEKVKQSYTRASLYKLSEDMKKFVMSDKAEVLNPSELIDYAETRLGDLSVSSAQHDEVYKMGDKTEEVLEERSKTPSQVPGIEVGFEEIDRITNGGLPGDLIITCAPSKTGKSVLLTNWAQNISIPTIDAVKRHLEDGENLPHTDPILYIDTEMSEREQEDRILSNLTGIPHDEIISGMYVLDTANGTAIDKVAKLKSARESLKLGNYYHIYMPHFTIQKVLSITRKFMIQFGIKALFFDYIKIPSSQADFKSIQEFQALGFFTSGLKDLAGTLKIPVFSACQTNRNDLDTDTPDASNIGGSYRILQLASKLMFLMNKTDEQIAKEGFQNGNQKLYIKYQRNGASDMPPINIFFNKPILRQSEV